MGRLFAQAWGVTVKVYDGWGVFPAIGAVPVVGLGLDALASDLAGQLPEQAVWLIYLAVAPLVTVAGVFAVSLLGRLLVFALIW